MKVKEIILLITSVGEVKTYEFQYLGNPIYVTKNVDEAIKFAEKKVSQEYKMKFKSPFNGMELG